MIKIVGPKKTNRDNEENKNAGGSKNPQNNPAFHRLTKDLSQIDIPKNATMTFPNKDDITNFDVTVRPEEGSYWYGATYSFSVSVPNDYPHEPPKIICNTKVFFVSRWNLRFFIDLSPQYRSQRQSLFEYFETRLEARFGYQQRYPRPPLLVH